MHILVSWYPGPGIMPGGSRQRCRAERGGLTTHIQGFSSPRSWVVPGRDKIRPYNWLPGGGSGAEASGSRGVTWGSLQPCDAKRARSLPGRRMPGRARPCPGVLVLSSSILDPGPAQVISSSGRAMRHFPCFHASTLPLFRRVCIVPASAQQRPEWQMRTHRVRARGVHLRQEQAKIFLVGSGWRCCRRWVRCVR